MEGQPQVERLLEVSSALALYWQTARRVEPDFALTVENLPAVSEICRLTEGMPLGLELAAAWMGLLTPGELLDELRQTPDILATEANTAPAGQRSLRAVFDTSWRLLAPSERQALRALAYFRGGFTRQAAEEVCAVALPALLSLVNKCWLKRDEGGRFSMHELLRQYGVEALAAESEQHAEIRRRHSAYYCDWLAAQEEAILGPQQGVALAAISQEIANIRRACLVAARTGETASLARAVPPLGLYHRWRGGYVAGDNLLGRLLQEVAEHAGGPEARHLAQARLLVWRVTLKSLLGEYQRATALGEEALTFLDQLEQDGQEMGLERLQIAVQQGYTALLGKRRPEEALRHFSEAYSFAQSLDSRWMAVIQVALARARRNLGQLEDAEVIAKKGVEILREKGSPSALAEAIALHGNILARMGRFQEAEALLEEDPQLSPAHPGIEAYRLVNLARTRFLLGKFEQAETAAIQGIAKYLENETLTGLAWTQTLCAIRLHQGRYVAAVESIPEFLPAALLSEQPELQAIEANFQGIRALMAREWAEAVEHLQWSRAARPSTPDLHHTWVDACLALVYRASGSAEEAAQALAAELRLTLASRAFPALMLVLPVGALLLADRGELGQATQIYTRVWQEPFARNSVWLREVAGAELEKTAARLPVPAREEAERRGQALDLWEMAAALLEAVTA
jgi:tetratricopeptide (TPR) repeat protein